MASGGPERLEVGRDPRPWGPRRVAVTSTVGVVMVAVVAGLLVADHRVRVRETRRVSACVSAARGAVTFTSARVDAILGYVRPTLEQGGDAALRRRLLRIISEAVAPTVPEVGRASERCRDARVLAVHAELRTRRSDCLRLLAADHAYLRAIVADGSHALGSRSLDAGTCGPPDERS